ncbi:MAG: hypothetical protein MIO93_08365 [ANME-2 cluster archaeon]|nr:hypothetical protein [ANME-2 cluster archaeon]
MILPAAGPDVLTSSGCSAAWPTVGHRLKMLQGQPLASYWAGCNGIRGRLYEQDGGFDVADCWWCG